MESYQGNVINTHRNDQGYWVAKVYDGPFKNLSSWQPTKKEALRLLRSVLDEAMKGSDLA